MTEELSILLNNHLSLLFWFIALFAAFGVLERIIPCNPGQKLLRKGFVTDAFYWFVIPLFSRYVRLFYAALLVAWVYQGLEPAEIDRMFRQGHGVIGTWPIWVQAIAYLVISDCILYWTHRMFHTRKLWVYHSVHHSSQEIDWLSANRFHPVNTWLTFTLVDVMLLGAGFSLFSVVLLAPFNIIFSAFVHANINCTLGPLRYVLASPVFHRWHHTMLEEGRNKNFAPTFPVLDVIFGTFYMPKNRLPEHYGIDDPDFPEDFLGQMAYPFRKKQG